MAPNFRNIKFGRRKSQGNALDENDSAPPSARFRVIPRDDAVRKSTGNQLDLRKSGAPNPQGQSSHEDDWSPSNRGSNSSASTGPQSHLFETTNTRFSSTSTLQSPMEAMKKDRSPSPHFLKLGDDFDNDWGDMFSSVTRKSGLAVDDSAGHPYVNASRSGSEPILSNLPKAFSNVDRTTNTSSPLSSGPRRDMTNSASIWDKPSSKDTSVATPELGSPVFPAEESLLFSQHNGYKEVSKPNGHFRASDPAEMAVPPLRHSASLRSQNSFTQSAASEDADALMVRDSVRAVRASTIGIPSHYAASPLGRERMSNNPTSRISIDPIGQPSRSLAASPGAASTSSTASSSASHDPLAPNKCRPHSTTDDSDESTPRGKIAQSTAGGDGDVLFEHEIVQAIHKANNRSLLGLPEQSPQSSAPNRPGNKRIMSMAEFNKQKDVPKYPSSVGRADETDSEDGYEDDDDDDPAVHAQKRRLEQQKEAQHAVWRQQMKRAIGDQSSLPLRPEYGRSNQSAPSLMFHGTPETEDEDDDIPLAILQAHSFGKNPDPRLSQNSYVGVQDRSGTPARVSSGGQRTSQLPVFARRLPEDPYFGASDVATPSVRESMNFRSRTQSVFGGSTFGPPPGVSPVSGVPPGGLVNVIAQEEHLRSGRRGSPAAGGAAMAYNMPGIGNVPGQPMLLPLHGDETIRQQQLLEVMQQNNMMMKEMMDLRAQMQIFQMGGAPGSMPMSGLPGPGLGAARSLDMADRRSITPSIMYGRSASFVGQTPTKAFMQQQVGQTGGPKSAINLSLDLPQFRSGAYAGYTPSIAPSERSNVGQPSRYRPVNSGDGGSTITAGSTPRPSSSRLSMAPTSAGAKFDGEMRKSGFLHAVMHNAGRRATVSQGDDDEEQWGARRRRR